MFFCGKVHEMKWSVQDVVGRRDTKQELNTQSHYKVLKKEDLILQSHHKGLEKEDLKLQSRHKGLEKEDLKVEPY